MKTTGIQIKNPAVRPDGGGPTKPQDAQAFQKIFDRAREKEGIKFSKHARERMMARGIELNNHDMSRLAAAVDQLDEKGGSTSLLLMGKATFVTNVKERTIITALDNSTEDRKVFTQIDSVVLVDS
jgi:flagellar operon protein